MQISMSSVRAVQDAWNLALDKNSEGESILKDPTKMFKYGDHTVAYLKTVGRKINIKVTTKRHMSHNNRMIYHVITPLATKNLGKPYIIVGLFGPP